jgi:fluoride exporter
MSVFSVLSFIYMGCAGALGALGRYLLGHFVAGRLGTTFPYGTLIINVTGSLCIGFIFALTGRHVLSTATQSIVATGFLGGYTTFSTMSWEGVQLARGGRVGTSIIYLGGNVILGLVAVSVGIAVGWWL